ncbi:hypothetical protein A2U01_0057477, partial [Trifolium medium]|nr:hypothetical protein [Trifolium medium]
IEGWSINQAEHNECKKHQNQLARWHDKRPLPSTRSVYAPSPFEQSQADSSLDKSSAWVASNKIDSSNS